MGLQRRVNEDAHALQTVAFCDGLPQESLVAFATVILHALFTCLRPFCVLRPRDRANSADHPASRAAAPFPALRHPRPGRHHQPHLPHLRPRAVESQ